jgi:fido (protein-threonine AMPylation protein)
MATQEEIKKKWELAQRTSLWKRTLGSPDEDVRPLRESFLDARKNAIFLLDKIRKDFPNLTVHDITHVDSLWNVADTIIGEDYPINPLEGYILGVAFLIHDAVLSYDAVGGKDKLRDTIEWKDAYADGPGDKDEEEFKKECDFAAIRILHAKYAEDILNKKFERDNTTTFYIIDNDEYRAQFGDMIGKIAASHHWCIDEVESRLDIQINPIAGLPSDWEINEQKLACILRCADAGHIDNGRAPFGIYNSLIVNGVSRNHWESQTRLGQVRENRKSPEQLLITSTRPFEKNNFAAWNVAYDAVKLFDEELKKSNELLKSEGLSFPHIGVTGAESKEVLSDYIKTNGWQPCSVGIHTGNAKDLIEKLGGSKLYGEDNLLLVALRELIQNARDAIQARRTMEGRPEEGRITIRLKEEERKRWIEVEDDGIGMSLDCIKNHLLDFGSSYWKSNMAKYENPGLRSKGFKSIGKFGIGFYSVFMVAKSVEVVTRRYNKAVDDAKRIEFPEGLTLSPILSDVKQSTNVSTLVKFELKDKVDLEFHIVGTDTHFIKLPQALSIVVAGLDADVYFEENGQIIRIHPNVKDSHFAKEEWLRGLFIRVPINVEELASKLEQLLDDQGDLRGWLLPPKWISRIDYPELTDKAFYEKLIPSIKTIGGLSSKLDFWSVFHNNDGILGYVDGIEYGISRNKMFFDESLKISLKTWVKENYCKDYDDIINNRPLAKGYEDLISFCMLEDDIAMNNIIRFYATLHSDIQYGTIESLIMIHYYLFVGVIHNPGEFRFYEELKNSKTSNETIYTKINIYMLLVKSINYGMSNELLQQLLDKEDDIMIKRMIIIKYMPASSYDEIIDKYCLLSLCAPFKDGNKRALGIWLNIMLNNVCNQMIDWRIVNNNKLMKKIKSAYSNAYQNMPQMKISEKEFEMQYKEMIGYRRDMVSGYLKQFLSSNYLTEITIQSDENT